MRSHAAPLPSTVLGKHTNQRRADAARESHCQARTQVFASSVRQAMGGNDTIGVPDRAGSAAVVASQSILGDLGSKLAPITTSHSGAENRSSMAVRNMNETSSRGQAVEHFYQISVNRALNAGEVAHILRKILGRRGSADDDPQRGRPALGSECSSFTSAKSKLPGFSCSRKARVSCRSNRNAEASISNNSFLARSEASGSGGSVRVVSTTWV